MEILLIETIQLIYFSLMNLASKRMLIQSHTVQQLPYNERSY